MGRERPLEEAMGSFYGLGLWVFITTVPPPHPAPACVRHLVDLTFGKLGMCGSGGKGQWFSKQTVSAANTLCLRA